MYGLLPECILRCLANELESLKRYVESVRAYNMNNDNGKYLSASLTHVRLLASVYSCMYREGGSLDELFAAVRIVADMRPYPAVNSLYITC